MNFRGKQVAVLGIGRSGEAAAILLVCLGARVTLMDSAEADVVGAAKLEKLSAMGMKVIAGDCRELVPTPLPTIWRCSVPGSIPKHCSCRVS